VSEMAKAAAALLVLLLCGCTSWPDEGTGGLAERLPGADPRLVSLDLRMREAKANGAMSYAAALSAETEQRIILAHRLSAAGQPREAETALEDAEVLLDMIDQRTRRSGRTAGTGTGAFRP
jgi:hypothetical protein